MAFKVLSLRQTDIVQDQLDVFNLLQDVQGPIQGHLRGNWASRYDFSTDFYRAAASDLSGPLAQTSMRDPKRVQRGLMPGKNFLPTKQYLSRHPDFHELMLTTDNMACVSRSDGEYTSMTISPREATLTYLGVLLTMLSSMGIDYIRDVKNRIPWPNVMLFEHEYVLGMCAHSRRRYDTIHGTEGITKVDVDHNTHVELLLLDIILGFYSTPMVRNYSKSGPEDAYEVIVQELVSLSHSLVILRRDIKRRVSFLSDHYHIIFCLLFFPLMASMRTR